MLDVAPRFARHLEAAYDRIAAARPLLQPIIAAWQVLSAPTDDTAGIRRTLIETYHPELSLTSAGAVYAVAGLAVGTLISRAVLALLSGLRRAGADRRPMRHAR